MVSVIQVFWKMMHLTHELAPANDIIRYKNIRHDAEDHSPYVSSDPPLIDELWMDLYDCQFSSLLIERKPMALIMPQLAQLASHLQRRLYLQSLQALRLRTRIRTR